MRYGGHQTFPIREGWLSKALSQLNTDPTVFARGCAADSLGVGSNMANSIEHWIVATGLAEKLPRVETTRDKIKYRLTWLGELVWKFDPYFTLDETWWLLHINLINTSEHAATWNWFFNYFPDRRFDKVHFVSRLKTWEKQQQLRSPADNTIERDANCFLSTYARSVPKDSKDPEEDYGCPFQELRLMSFLRSSGSYEVHRHGRDLRPEVLLYSILRCSGDPDTKRFDISFSQLSKNESGPLQAFVLGTEDLFESILHLESTAKDDYRFSIRGLAGDRQISFQNPGAAELVRSMYARVVEE